MIPSHRETGEGSEDLCAEEEERWEEKDGSEKMVDSPPLFPPPPLSPLVFVEGRPTPAPQLPARRKRALAYASLLFATLIIVCFVVGITATEKKDTPPPTSPDLVISTASGVVQGVAGPLGSRRFFGIPYAAPPVGGLRWRPPQPPSPWDGTLHTTRFRTGCFDLSGKGAEDCLYLNIFAPRDAKGLPVMHFIHGGCYSWGEGGDWGASDPHYHADALAVRQRVVVVTAEYRLGPLGFLGSEALRSHSAAAGGLYANVTGNFGILDQNMALQWVRDNIAAFGGDPGRVLLFGQSAGAGSISLHLATGLSDGLFHRAALHSGAFSSWITQPMAVGERNYKTLARKVGCRGSEEEVLRCLVQADPAALSNAGRMPDEEVACRDGCSWAPVVDGVLVENLPWRVFRDGSAARTAHIPLLILHIWDDGYEFVNDTLHLPRRPTEEQWLQWARKSFERPGHNPAEELRRLYLRGGDQRYPRAQGNTLYNWRYYAASAAETDAAFACPSRRTVRDAVTAGHSVWKAAFRRVHTRIGFAPHSEELSHLFGYEPDLLGPGDHQLSGLMMQYWGNFAHHGNPNGEGLPDWPSYTDASRTTAVLDGSSSQVSVTTEIGFREEECNYWDQGWNYFGTCLPQPGRRPYPCTTTEGFQCAQLFGLGDITLQRCAAPDHGNLSSDPWCATKTDAAGYPLEIGTCDFKCETSAMSVDPPRVHREA